MKKTVSTNGTMITMLLGAIIAMILGIISGTITFSIINNKHSDVKDSTYNQSIKNSNSDHNSNTTEIDREYLNMAGCAMSMLILLNILILLIIQINYNDQTYHDNTNDNQTHHDNTTTK